MKTRTLLLIILASIAAAFAVVGLTSCSTSHAAPPPTPPPLLPEKLTWTDDNQQDPNVAYYNIYEKDGVTGQFSYIATVTLPAPLSYTLPPGIMPGTLFTVTACDGAQESAKATPPAAYPPPPDAPGNVRISATRQ